ncbi:MAG TPA: TatD family hydrolase [Gemmatimonadales bacterium]|nr:TatD family hydrolase [Gemmatimonadales bacterium]
MDRQPEGPGPALAPLVDTHCHLADPAFDSDRGDVLTRARAAGVAHVIVIADSVETTERCLTLAHAHGLSATAGVHPHHASTWSADAAARLADALAHPAVVAVGETGLDYHYDHSPRLAQRRAFEAQLCLAAEHRRPVVVHGREADPDLARLVREWGPTVPALVLHSFSSGPTVFEAGVEVGAYFSFSGMITFRNWPHANRVAECPAERLLLETDAPYLAPVPMRGRRNEPAFVRYVATRTAEIRGDAPETIAGLTTMNATRCFGTRIGLATL